MGGLLAAAVILWLYMLRCRVLFDFNRGGLMGQVHQYLTDHLPWDGRGTLLDIGCGSGALTIRCAKRFPNASLVGVDYWGAAWSYAKEQCQQNAAAEGVSHRVHFQKGDAAHLAFPDETFEAAVSNFVFHEVRTQPDKREVVREALRVVKKGGCFAFQDLFEKESLYGDMTDFCPSFGRQGCRSSITSPMWSGRVLFPDMCRPRGCSLTWAFCMGGNSFLSFPSGSRRKGSCL